MKKAVSIALVAFCSLGVFFCSEGKSTPPPAGKKIVIIRHGEKPDDGDNLSCKGLNRSLQLSEVLNKKFGVPAAVFVPSLHTGKKTSTARMYQTVIPFAVKYNLTVNSKYDVDDVEGLAQALKQADGTSIVVWEHKKLNNLVKALGLERPANWADDDYDTIWIITFNGAKASLTADKEGIAPRDTCP